MALTNASRLADFGTGIGTQGAILQVDNADQMVGIGTTDPTSKLEVKGDFKVSAASTLSGAVKISDSTNSTSTTTGALIVTGGVGIGASLHVDGDVSIGGTLTYEDVTNIDSVGLLTARSGLRVTAGGVVVTAGVSTISDNLKVSGGEFTVGTGVTIGIAGVTTFSGTSDIHLVDDVQLMIGDSSDTRLYHDGDHTYLSHGGGTGDLRINANTLQLMSYNSEVYFKGTFNGSSEIYYDNSKKWETTTAGTVTTGVATVTGASTIGGILDVTGDLRVNTDKFIAESATGNMTVAGTSAFTSKATVNATLQCNEGLLVNVGVTTLNGVTSLQDSILIHTTTTYPATSSNTHGGAYFEKGGSSSGTSFFIARTNNVPLYVGRNDTGSYIQLSKSGVAEGSINLRGDDRLCLATSAEQVLEVNNTGVRLGITTTNTVMVGSDTNSTKLMTIKETNNATTGGTGGGSYYNLLIGGNTHLVGRGYGIGFDPEAYPERVKIGILCEGNSTGYSRGNLHIVMNNDGNSTEATISDSVMSFLPTGRVGINSTVPTLPLDVSGEGIAINRNAGDPYIALQTDGTTHTMVYGGASTGFRVWTKPSGGTLTNFLQVTTDGDVLINQPAEAAGRLGIKGTNSNGSTCYAVTNSGKALEGIDVNCTTVGDGNYGGGISFGCGGNGRSAIAGYQDGGDDDVNGLTFFTHSSAVGSDNTVERMRLLATGRLGLYTEATGGTTAARFQIGKDDSDPVAPMIWYGPFGKNGKMFGKYVHNGSGATSNNTNLLTITAFQSTNSHIFGKVNVMGVSPVADYGFEAEGFFYGERGSSNTDITNANFGTMDLVGGTNQTRGTGGSAQGSLSFSGTTLVYATPAVAYATMRINVEFMTYDGATVVFDASQGLD